LSDGEARWRVELSGHKTARCNDVSFMVAYELAGAGEIGACGAGRTHQHANYQEDPRLFGGEVFNRSVNRAIKRYSLGLANDGVGYSNSGHGARRLRKDQNASVWSFEAKRMRRAIDDLHGATVFARSILKQLCSGVRERCSVVMRPFPRHA